MNIEVRQSGLGVTTPGSQFLRKLLVLALLLGIWAAALPARAAVHANVTAWGAGMVLKPKDNNDFGQSLVPTTVTNALQVAGGWRHSLALKPGGKLKAWGDDTLGQTDFPVTNFFFVTNIVSGTNHVYLTNSGIYYEAIACGYLHSLALQSNGVVLAAGYDAFGQTEVPANLSNVVAVACGFYHSVALKADGTVAAWGTSTNSKIIGTDNIDFGQSLVPAGLSNVVAIAGGGWHSLALKADGTVTGWGAGTGFNTNFNFHQDVAPPGVSNVVAISSGAADSMVLEANGHVIAWGDNTFGQTNVPSGLSNVVAIASGGWHNLALKSDGTVVAWGAGIGSNTNVDYKQNVVPTGLSNTLQIAAGTVNSLALTGTNPPVMTVPLTMPGRSANGFAITLPTRNGRVYRLEYKNSLTDSNWNAFPLQAGTGGMTPFTDPGTSAAQRFYRVTRW